MTGMQFSRTLVAINGGVPLALLAWDAARGQLGANPVNFAIRTTGLLSLIFLLMSLTVTPVRRLTGLNWLVSYRRSLGLYGFAYAAVHLGIYVGLDRALSLASTWTEIVSRRYLQVGIAGVLLMVPLAATSTNGMIRRLGPRRWKALHRLAYVAAAAGALHYYMQAKSDVRQPLAFAGVLAGLLASRAVWHYFDLRKAARGPPARGQSRPRPRRYGRPAAGAAAAATARRRPSGSSGPASWSSPDVRRDAGHPHVPPRPARRRRPAVRLPAGPVHDPAADGRRQAGQPVVHDRVVPHPPRVLRADR
jgi:sulfoxide reductase heme-binding subunit YedZ